MQSGSIAITNPAGELYKVPLQADRLSIGSAPENDIVLNSPDIAPRHATIICEPNGRLVLEIGGENLVGQGGMRLTFNLAQMARQRDLAWIGEYVISYQPPLWSCRTQPMRRADRLESDEQPSAAPAPCHSADDTNLLHTLLRQTFPWQSTGEGAHEAPTIAMPMLLLSAAPE